MKNTHTHVKCVGRLLVNEDVWSLAKSQQPTAGVNVSTIALIVLRYVLHCSAAAGMLTWKMFLIREINYLHLSA